MAARTKPQPTTQPTPAGIAPRMLTVSQAAAYAGCAVWAIRTAIWEKALSACTIGRRLLIPREGLDA
jgi:excisionase family DNA binding protein